MLLELEYFLDDVLMSALRDCTLTARCYSTVPRLKFKPTRVHEEDSYPR